MSTKYPQGVITATPPFQSTTAQSYSGVWTLEQLGKNYFYYQQPVAKSLRFRASATGYLSRTPSTGGNRTTWTWSAWVKRGALSSQMTLFGCMPVTGTDSTYFEMQFTAGDVLNIAGFSTNFAVTSQVFRDPSSWYHIVLVADTTQVSSNARIRLYVNGAQVTAFGTTNYPAQNAVLGVNQSIQHSIASEQPYNATRNFDGYLAEVNFIDGQALDPSYFGQLSTITGVWAPKKYVGSYGGNGFYLPFTDATSTTTLGYDYSGNSNNWTTNNISLTSGSTYDSMWDSPTSYDNGVNGVGNYCTWNPLSGTSGTTANGNLYFYGPGSYASRIGTLALPTSGKWYYEVTITVAPYTPRGSTTAYNWIGVAYTINFNVSTTPGVTNVNGVMLGDNGYINNFASASSDAGITFALNDVIGIAIDTGANTYAFYKNNSSVASGTINMTAGTSLSPMHLSYDASNGAMQANFGQRPFAYTPPTGFKALNTQNLPAPSIANGANHMAATTYTGNGATQSIVNAYNSVSFQPDFVWVKSRSGAGNHSETDSVRGVNKQLFTNLTDAEGSQTDQVTALNSNGFALGANSAGTGSVNVNGVTYVAWQWKAGGTAVTNTAGSITSQVSANPTAGFSVVTYTGNGTNPGATIGHGLGIAPSMIITKARNTAGTWWPTYHSALPISNTLYLNDTVASTTYVNRFSAVSSSTFTTGTNGSELNTNAVTYVAYCFAAIPGYSAFGSYTGNGSTNGPFVYLGFRPRFILTKMTNNSGNYWIVHDTARDPYNAATQRLYPNVSDAEATATDYDILSNGFKLRTTAEPNGSGNTFIYAAFAENPFKYSLAR